MNLTAGPLYRAGALFALDCSIAPSEQPGPCQCPDSQNQTTPHHKGRPILGDRCHQPNTPLPYAHSGTCLLQWAHRFKTEQLGNKGHFSHPFFIGVWEYSCQIWSIHERRLSQLKRITDCSCVLTDTLTDSFIVSFEEQGWKALMKMPHKHRSHWVGLRKNYLFLCVNRCFFV